MEVPGKASVPMDGPDTSTQRESGIGLGPVVVTLSLPGMDLDQISGDPRKCFNLGPEYFVSKTYVKNIGPASVFTGKTRLCIGCSVSIQFVAG